MDETVDEAAFNANIGRIARSTLMRDAEQSIHRELIDYAVASCRLFYIQDASAWKEWKTNNEAFRDLTTKEVCHLFLTDVLPQLDTYQLTEMARQRLKLLDLHPFFKRVGQGYQYAPDCDLAARFVVQPQKNFILTNDIPKIKKIDSLKRCQTVLVENDEVEQKTCFGYQSKVTLESTVVFSVLLSTNHELSIGKMLDIREIHARLRRAKQSFEDTARVTPYRINIDDLIYNLDVCAKVRSKLCRVISDCKKY
ncbi:uncharacterized protein LOC6542442 [Drosophila erecta]|uniref:Uncharacterized protein n=1 Tax=Drosophila erecta TaxID=7220 RepID=B3N9D9_DROER|nr:uncharacterized protein LOC6542442 [Drosophila erecta]EDV59626.1 uncharacterized protein Dere_GG10706 [Drosophila erecta]